MHGERLKGREKHSSANTVWFLNVVLIPEDLLDRIMQRTHSGVSSIDFPGRCQKELCEIWICVLMVRAGHTREML